MDYLIGLAQDPAAWVALTALVAMELVLGIDNLIFISILTNKLPEAQRERARTVGLSGALLMRIALLGSLFWIVSLKEDVINILGNGFSWRDIILILGGLFLVYKATKEIHEHTEHKGNEESLTGVTQADVTDTAAKNFAMAIAQILMVDLVFSIDSILTAVGMTNHLPIMILAVLITVGVMFVAAGPLANFIGRHPSIVMLALGFLLMIGAVLIMEGMGGHIEKGYIYTAMAFAAFIEILQMQGRKAAANKKSH
jgi:predicted tellurium resistance membrane protein TerC